MALRNILAPAGALLVAGCASFAPYPTRYQTNDIDAPPAGATCTDHDSRMAVIGCLQWRAQGWEKRGANLRGQSRLTGTFAIPAAATAIGLAAQNDPNHAVMPLGLLTGALVSHTSAYARADQAKVAEAATAAYGCLIRQAGDWQGELYEGLVVEYNGLRGARAALEADLERVRALRRPVETTSLPARFSTARQQEAQGLIRAINGAIVRGDAQLAEIDASLLAMPTRQVAQANVVVEAARVREAATGSDLVGQAIEIDRAATAAIADLQPDAAAVASSATSGVNAFLAQFTPTDTSQPEAATPAPAATPDATPDGPQAPQAVGGAPGGDNAPAEDSDRTQIEALESLKAKLRDAQAYESRSTRLLADINGDLTAFDDQQVRFKAAAEAYKPTSVATSCLAERFGGPAAFAVAPGSPIVLSGSGKASFELKGGVPPHRFVRAPEDVKVNMMVISSMVTHVEVELAAGAGAGPWDLVFYDGSANATSLTVKVQKPAT